MNQMRPVSENRVLRRYIGRERRILCTRAARLIDSIFTRAMTLLPSLFEKCVEYRSNLSRVCVYLFVTLCIRNNLLLQMGQSRARRFARIQPGTVNLSVRARSGAWDSRRRNWIFHLGSSGYVGKEKSGAKDEGERRVGRRWVVEARNTKNYSTL